MSRNRWKWGPDIILGIYHRTGTISRTCLEYAVCNIYDFCWFRIQQHDCWRIWCCTGSFYGSCQGCTVEIELLVMCVQALRLIPELEAHGCRPVAFVDILNKNCATLLANPVFNELHLWNMASKKLPKSKHTKTENISRKQPFNNGGVWSRFRWRKGGLILFVGTQ